MGIGHLLQCCGHFGLFFILSLAHDAAQAFIVLLALLQLLLGLELSSALETCQ